MIDYLSRAKVHVTYSPIAATKQIRVQTEDRTHRRRKKLGRHKRGMRRGNEYTQKQKLRVAWEYLVFCIWLQLKAENIAKNEMSWHSSEDQHLLCFFSTKVRRTSWASIPAPSSPKASNSRTQQKSYSEHITYLLSLDSSIRTSHAFNHII